MKKLSYLNGTECEPVTEIEVASFKEAIGLDRLSETFVSYCRSQNGGVPAPSCEYFVPDSSKIEYWNLCQQRFINPAGEIDVNILLGITSDKDFSILHWTSNARRIWGLAGDYFCVAYDGIGSKIVSRLVEGADQVYFWEPHVEPHFFLIADSLADFYDGLGMAPDVPDTELD
jgi:hypothetical protein